MRAVVVDVTPITMGMRLPYSYQSRPASLPSPNTFFGALLRAAYLIGGVEAYERVAEAVDYVAYSVKSPLTIVTTLLRRVRMDYGGYEPGGKNPSNVFQESFIIPSDRPSFTVTYFVREGRDSAEQLRAVLRAASSMSLVGDSDSPANTGGSRVCEVFEEGSEGVTGFTALFGTASIVGGEAIMVDAPIMGFKGAASVTMRRVMRKLVIPARVRGNVILPSSLAVEARGGAVVVDVCGNKVLLPPTSQRRELRAEAGLP